MGLALLELERHAPVTQRRFSYSDSLSDATDDAFQDMKHSLENIHSAVFFSRSLCASCSAVLVDRDSGGAIQFRRVAYDFSGHR